jgi:hypothetical protein
LRLWLSSEQTRQNKEQDDFVRKAMLGTYPDMGIMGLDSGFPEPPDGFCEGPSVEPPIGLVILGARADGTPEVLCADEAIWPQVLMPNNGALASDADVAASPIRKLRGDRTRGRGATDLS